MFSKSEVLNIIKCKDSTSVLLGTVSGVASTKPSLIRFFNEDVNAIDVITTKSFQVKKNDGNREPIICEPKLGTFGNSVGLRNPGMEVALAQLKKLRKKNPITKILNVSVSASSPEDFILLIKTFEDVADIIELNFSCPHAASGYGSSIGCDVSIAEDYVKKIKQEIPNSRALIFAKLTPNVKNISEIAKAVIDAGADGITAINTVGPELYIEENSGKAILNNKLGGKGGKSGLDIFERAVIAITEIRKAVGKDIPIFGMGGVANGEQVAKLINAGANIVGVGSVLGRVHQKNWINYLSALKSDAIKELSGVKKNTTSEFIINEKRLEYIPKKIISRYKDSKDVVILTLDGEMPFFAGEFVFVWIPGIGEKPFSLALPKPITIEIKRRGKFTKAIFDLNVGDTVYIRGLYGAPVKYAKTKHAVLLAGGTGIAVLPMLAQTLTENGCKISTYIGTSEEKLREQNQIEEFLIRLGSYNCVADNGVPGRVIKTMENDIKNKACGFNNFVIEDETNFAAYLVGPMIFMKTAAEMLKSMNVPTKNIFISFEMNTMCGIGICGECACGKKLTCQYGTFFTYAEYESALKDA
ncbi:MAG: dihydroorotate dehydrogenase [Treponema sp.]|nr:MAG: dihydroorotate dehydrogenase [Treponema sp.]